MKDKKLIYIGLFIFALLIILFVSDEIETDNPYVKNMNEILDIVAKIAATASLFGLLYQFKKEHDLKEAEFVVNINNSFLGNKDITEIYRLLEQSKEDKQKTDLFKSVDIIKLVNYISFFGSFHYLVESGIVDIKTIDILSYRFFLVTNNKFVQEKLIAREDKYTAFWKIYKLHKNWKDHVIKVSKKNKITDNSFKYYQEEYDLSKTKYYDKMVSELKY